MTSNKRESKIGRDDATAANGSVPRETRFLHPSFPSKNDGNVLGKFMLGNSVALGFSVAATRSIDPCLNRATALDPMNTRLLSSLSFAGT